MEIDLTFLNLTANTIIVLAWLMGGVFILFFLSLFLVILVKFFWLPARKKKYLDSINFILLAVDIPKNNEQSPKAVEHIFATISGVLSGPNLYERYWLGMHQLSLSLELVSLEGYVQFLVYLPEKYRDVVEAAFYAQYPEAEISEVQDYTNLVPNTYPDDTFDLWGSDFKLGEKEAYPLRTYPRFEHSLSQELKDPMASLLEVMSRLGKGEYIWLQWIIIPVGPDWKKQAQKEVKKIIGEKVEEPRDIGYYITYPMLALFKWLGDVLVAPAAGQATSRTENGLKKEPNKLLYLTAGEKDIVQGIEEKMSKIGFLSKGRMIYAARRQVFDKNKSVNAVIGALNQFNTLNLNYLTKVKTTTTNVDYFFVKTRIAKRQNRILKAYQARIGDKTFGSKPFILNIEELATLYHFPGLNVKAPMLKTTESKKGEPPVRLPIDTSPQASGFPEVITPAEGGEADAAEGEDKYLSGIKVVVPGEEKLAVKRDSPPTNLPI